MLLLSACGGETDGTDGTGSAAPEAPVEQPANGMGTDTEAAKEARAITSESLPYAEVSGELVYGYFTFPADMVDPLPAVVVIHEWWGLNDNVREMADRIAAEGYIVLAVDLFGGKTADTIPDANALRLDVFQNPSVALGNLEQAIQFVGEVAGAPRVATLGWRFGGVWSLNSAVYFKDGIDAGVIFYGAVDDNPEKLDAIEAPILGLFAGDDLGVTPESVRSFEAAMNELEKPVDVQIYDGAKNGFFNPATENYNAAAAQDAWARTLAFLSQELQPSDSGESDAGSSN